jgi:hypothetical protein
VMTGSDESSVAQRDSTPGENLASELASGTSSPSAAGAEELEAPREGTLAWLALQPHTLVHGLEVPECHRIPADATLAPYTGEKACRVIRASGERCGATATRRYQICLAHAGGGMTDYSEMSKRGHARQARLRQTRAILGVTHAGRHDPRAVARMRALERSEDLAAALLAPLDDSSLESLQMQRAAVTALDATYPLQTATLELQIPASGEDVSSLGWEDLQSLAARMLADQSEPLALEP